MNRKVPVILATRRYRTGLAVLAISVAVVVGGGIYVLGLVMSDNLEFRESSFAYAIIVRSHTLREFPRYAASGETIYFTYSTRDGTAPEQVTMRYDSAESIDDLEQKHLAHCTRQDYSLVPESEFLLASRLACDANDYRIEVNLQLQRNNATTVTVVFLGTLN